MNPMRHIAAVLFASASLIAQPYAIDTAAGGVPPQTPVPAMSASISPSQVAADPSGNVYFSSRNAVFKIDAGNSLTRIAGNARPGFSGDGGPAAGAQLNNPNGLAVDASGNLYVADTGNGRIRRVSIDGLIATVAGAGGTANGAGDGGPANLATLYQPFGVALDSAGNLYLVDNVSVRKVSSDGIIRTVASCSSYQCGAPPTAIAADSSGVVYVAVNSRVWKIPTAGIIAAVAGTPTASGGYSGEGGPATQAVLGRIGGLAVSSQGTLYLADTLNDRILRIAGDGTVSTIAGGPATGAPLAGPNGLAIDKAGNIYVAEAGDAEVFDAGGGPVYISPGGQDIRKIASNGTMTTVAGNGSQAYSGDGGMATAAQLNAPWGVAADGGGNLYIGDSGNHTVRKIAANGTISTVAGTGVRGDSGDGGPAALAQIDVPLGVAVDGAGSVYVAECLGARIRKLSAAGAIATVAGTGTAGYAGDGGPAVNAELACPHGVAVDASGNLFIADTYNHRVRKIGPDGTISTVAGNGTPGFSGDGGPALKAQLSAPTSLAMDASGNLYVADTGNNRIRRISRDGTISTVAGCADMYHESSDDGLPATSAVLSGPQGVAADTAGNLYIAETRGNHVRRVSAAGIISTVAGRALYGYLAYFDGNLDLFLHGYSGDGGPATSALLGSPYGLAVDSNFNVYVADLPNGAVRMLKPSPIANAASMLAGPIAAGEAVTLFGFGLGPASLVTNPPDGSGALGTEVAGTQVFFDGVAAPVIYTSATQVAAIVPSVTGSTASVEVRYLGGTAARFTAALVPFAPALFTYDSTGRGLAAAIDRDHSYNSLTASAAPGDTVTLFATGDGLAAQPSAAVTVTIGGVAAQIVRVGPAPGLPGVTQIDVTVPANALAATTFLLDQDLHVPVPVVLQVGGISSQPAVYITVLYLGGFA